MRAGAHKAASVLLMLSATDAREGDASEGTIRSGGTLASLLALRHVLLTSGDGLTPALRVTAQLSSPCRQACFGKLARWLWPALGVLPFLSDVCTSGWFVAMSVAWPVLGALRHVLPTSGDGLAALRVTAQLSSP